MKSNNSTLEIENQTKQGYFGEFGGMFVPPVLEPKLIELIKCL
jgi:tryptophan synthase beta subunit